jgi:hypothetical protein
MKKLLTALFSLLTATGGHLLRRRWDQVLLFFALLVIWELVGWIVVSQFGLSGEVDDPVAMIGTMRRNTLIILAGTGVVLLASAVTTWFEESDSSRASIAGIVGGALVTLVSVALIGTQVAAILSLPSASELHNTRGDFAISAANDGFFEEVYYGEPDPLAHWGGKARMESGDGLFMVAVTYHEAPAAGVELSVTFANGKDTGWATTDSAGQAVFHLPPGDYLVKSLRSRGWSNRPKGRKVYLDNDLAPALGSGLYHPHQGYLDQTGLKIHVAEAQPAHAQVTTRIRDTIQLLWPPADGKEASADLTRSALRWQAVPGAVKYRVQLSEVQKNNARSTSYFPVQWQDVTQPTLALSTLSSVASSAGDTHYTTDIFAFDATGKLIAKTGSFSGDGRFVLQGTRRFSDMQNLPRPSVLTADDATIERIEREQRRLNAVEVLINDGLTQEAHSLIKLVQSPEVSRRKHCLMGYLLSKLGDCDAARETLAELTLDDPDYVIPQHYLSSCEATDVGGEN